MLRTFIPDGYTEDVYIKEAKGLHPAVRFKVRTLTTPERNVYHAGMDGLNEQEATVALAKLVATRVLSWNLKDDDSTAVKTINTESVLRLRPALFMEIANVVRGYRGTDPDPETDPDIKEQAKKGEAALESAMTGIPMKDLLESQDAGNSPAG